MSGTAAALGLLAGTASAINVTIDYTYDTQNFFGTGNPEGLTGGNEARAAIEAAADYFSDLLTDTFSSVQTPADYISTPPFGSGSATYSWNWSKRFNNPATGSTVSIADPTIAADELIVYAGGRALGGNTLGLGGPGGFSWGGSGGYYTSAQLDEINAITDTFRADVERRGQSVGDFGSWGGSVTFDTDGTDWHFDHLTEPAWNESDFFSVAIHEIGHALGFGTADEWDALVSGSTFLGSASFAENGNVYPTLSADRAHWIEDTMSTVRETGVAQETSMDPDLLVGTRKVWTDLDTAGLEDIGWDIAELVIAGLAGDFNASGSVEQADLDLVLTNWGGARTFEDGVTVFASANVDQEELDIVLTQWGSSAAPSFAGFAVPEPAGLLSLTAVSGVLLRQRRDFASI